MPSLLLIIAENRASISSLFTKAGEADFELSEKRARKRRAGARKDAHARCGLMARSLSQGCCILGKRRFSLENFALIFSFRFRLWTLPLASLLIRTPNTIRISHDAGHDHHELPFWRKYIISTDHKVIGIQYGITGLIFLFFGFSPHDADALATGLSRPGAAPSSAIRSGTCSALAAVQDGVMTPEFYNSLGAMHGTIMIFLGIVPIAFAAFGNFVVPLQIGAPDMTFPKINMASYQAFFVGRRRHADQLFRSGRRGQGRMDLLHARSPSSPIKGRTIILFGTAKRSGWSDSSC